MGAAMKRKSPGASPKEPDHGSDQPSPKRARQSSSPSDANTPSPPQASSLISSPLANPPRLGSGTSPLEQDVPDRALAEDSEAETEALSGAQDESRPQTPELDSQSSSAASSASPRADILEESVAPSPAPEPVDHPSPTPAPSVREAELVGKRPELNMRGQMDSVMTKGEEEAAKKSSAVTSLEGIEKQFAVFRDRIYEERLAELDAELAEVDKEDPTHPEFCGQKVCIDQWLDDNTSTLKKKLRYDMDYMQLAAKANWAINQSEFVQSVREIREADLKKCNELWFKIQQDPKHDKAVPEYIIPFPTDRAEQIKQQRSYNKEVSILSGVATYVGFPAAPSLEGVTSAAREEDLKAMRIRSQAPVVANQRSSPLPRLTLSASTKPPVAEDTTFFEQNPWAANPQRRSSHTTINRVQTPTTITSPAPLQSGQPPTQNRSPALTRPVFSPTVAGSSAYPIPGFAGGAMAGIAVAGSAAVGHGANIPAPAPKRRNYIDLINQTMPAAVTPKGTRLLGAGSSPVGGGPAVASGVASLVAAASIGAGGPIGGLFGSRPSYTTESDRSMMPSNNA